MIKNNLYRYEKKFILNSSLINNINDLENFLSIRLRKKYLDPNERKKMFRFFEDKLIDMNISFYILSGNIQKRLNDAILHIEKL